MVTVRKFFLILTTAFILLTPYISAQESSETSSTRVVRTEEGLRIFQTIYFPAVPDVYRYEIEVEQIIDGQTISIEKIETDANFFEVSLRVGYYRYRLSAFDEMNLLLGISYWQEFRVIPGIEPVGQSYQPFYGLYLEMANPDGILFVHGENFFENTEFALVRKSTDFNWSEISLEDCRDVIIPSQVTVSENMAALRFELGALRAGTYEIFIRNPGGLWICFAEVRVGFRRNTDYTISSGIHFDSYYFRFGWLPFKTGIENLGLEVEVYFLGFNPSETFTEDSIRAYAILSMLYQLPVSERLNHNFRLGAGGGSLFQKYDDSYPDVFYLNFGYSIQYFLWKNFFLEAGLDIHYAAMHTESFTPNFMTFKPGIGIGWQMGRWAEHTEVAEAWRQDYSVPVTHHPKNEHLFSVNWNPLLLLSGFEKFRYDSQTHENKQFIEDFNPHGLSLRYAYIPYRWGSNKLGFRLEFGILDTIDRKNNVDAEYEGVSLISLAIAGILYQRVLSENWQASAHTGIGISNPYNYHQDFDGVAFAMNFGASFQYFFWRNAFLELGMDVSIIFPVNNDDELKTALRPGIAVGWQFNHNNETGLRLPGAGLQAFDAETEESPEDSEYSQKKPKQRRLTENRDNFNYIGVSAGTGFTDPMLITTIHAAFTLIPNIFIEFGIDFGFISKYEDVNDYSSINPFLNIGYFWPLREQISFYIGAGLGPVITRYSFNNTTFYEDYSGGYYENNIESVNTSILCYNFTAGINLLHFINISYTLKTDFQSAGNKLSIGYILRPRH